MRVLFSLLVSVLLGFPQALTAQLPEGELRERVDAVQATTEVETLLRGTSAARMLREFKTAESLLARSEAAVRQAETSLINERIFFALASGQGSNGMQRAFRGSRKRVHLSPQEIAGFANNFPGLLLGGEFDEMILSFSPDHPDPAYQCECLAEKAWVHRVAGRLHESRVLWGELVSAWDRNPLEFDNADAQADWQGQYARNLARAGRTTDARAALDKGKAMHVSEEARPNVHRRWAQAHAELGDVAGAVALLEPLLESSTLVTVNSLATRFTWEPVRSDIAFQEMLSRHR